MIHVDVSYHVGSARDEVGKSGLAHFFEHMMFRGSTNVSAGQHTKIVMESGGERPQAVTFRDRTRYYQTVPANQLERVLWLEADRMGFPLDVATQAVLKVERDIVERERQSWINRPFPGAGLLFERLGEALYPEGHPYSWPILGRKDEVGRIDVNDLRKFFVRWYGPNNAVLTIGGYFDKEQALAWVKQYFGPIPRGPDVAMAEKQAVALAASRYTSVQHNIPLPRLWMAFPTVHSYHADQAPLDALAFSLREGETAVLYKNMVKSRLAMEASSANNCYELACYFAITATLDSASGKTLADLENIVRQSLEEFAAHGASDDDLERAEMDFLSRKMQSLESFADKVSQLATYQTFTGNVGHVTAETARYQDVSKEDVMRVYERYIAGKPAVVVSMVPHGRLGVRAGEDTWQRSERKRPEYERTNPRGIAYRPVFSDNFDRSVVPPAGENPTVTPPSIYRGELENGIRVLGIRNDETPTTTIRLHIEAGRRDEDLHQLGLAVLTEAMFELGRKNAGGRLQTLGSSITFAVNEYRTTAMVRSFTKNLDETMEILAEQITHPKFDPNDFARVQALLLHHIAKRKTVRMTAETAMRKVLLGVGNAIAHSDTGVAETVHALTVEDARNFHRTRFSPTNTSIVAVSDLDEQTVLAKLSSVLGGWIGPVVEATPLKPFPVTGKTKLYLIDNPAPHSEILIGQRLPPFDAAGEFYRIRLANFVLGDTFIGRINLNLRKDKGYVYSAEASLLGYEDYGLFQARARVSKENTAAAIVEFEREIRKGISCEEMKSIRNGLGQRDALKYETPQQKLDFLSDILTYDLADDFVPQQHAILAEVTADELSAVAAKHLAWDQMAIVVVGNKRAILPQLKELGYEIVHLDADGSPVADASED